MGSREDGHLNSQAVPTTETLFLVDDDLSVLDALGRASNQRDSSWSVRQTATRVEGLCQRPVDITARSDAYSLAVVKRVAG